MAEHTWGIYPADITPIVWWGARAIITDKRRGVELLWDRQSHEGDRGLIDVLNISDFIDGPVMNLLNENLRQGNLKGRNVLHIPGTEYEAVIDYDDRDSGGYWYLGVSVVGTKRNNKTYYYKQVVTNKGC